MKTKILLGLSIVYLLASVGCKKEPAKAPAQAPKAAAPVAPGSPAPGKTAQVLTLEHLDTDGTIITGLDADMSKDDVFTGSLKGFATGAAITATSSDDTKATVAIDPATGAITVSAVDDDNTNVDVVLTFSSPEYGNFAAASISHTITILAKVTPPTPPAAGESTFTARYTADGLTPLLTMTSAALKAGTEKVLVVVYKPVKLGEKVGKDDIKFWGTIEQVKVVKDTELSLGDYASKTKDAKQLKKNTTYSIAVYSVKNAVASFTDKASAAKFVQDNRSGALGAGVLQKQIISYSLKK